MKEERNCRCLRVGDQDYMQGELPGYSQNYPGWEVRGALSKGGDGQSKHQASPRGLCLHSCLNFLCHHTLHSMVPLLE